MLRILTEEMKLGACTIKHYGFVIYGEEDIFRSKLVTFGLNE
jgi:hypothetical protein